MTEQLLNEAEVYRENRQLRNALDYLLTELGQAQGVDVDVPGVRDLMPAEPGEANPIRPPWEREGYENKSAWQADRENGSPNR